MKTLYTFMLLCITGLYSYAQPGWFKEFYGDGNDKFGSTVFDNDGNVYVAGTVGANGSIGNPANETYGGFFVAKYTGTGQKLWIKFGRGQIGWGNTTQASVSAIAISGSNLYISGMFKDSLHFGSVARAAHKSAFVHGEIFLMKLDAATGDVLADEIYSGSSDAAVNVSSIKCDASGNVFMTGGFEENVDFGNSKTLTCWTGLYGELFVAKFNASLTCEWAVKPTSEMRTLATELCLDHNGDLIVTGSFQKGINFGAGNVFVAKGTNGNPSDRRNTYLAKYNKTDGSLAWVKIVYGDMDTRSHIAADASGNIYMVANYGTYVISEGDSTAAPSLNQQIVFIKYDNSGGRQWIKHYGGSGPDLGSVVAVNKDGDVLMSGNLRGSVTIDSITNVYGGPGANAIFVARFNSSGNVYDIYQYSANLSVSHGISGISTDKNSNRFILGGTFTGQIDFGTPGQTTNNNQGTENAYVVLFGGSGGPTGLAENKNTGTGINIYPNPASSIMNIDAAGAIQVDIYDLKGVLQLQSAETRIDISTFSPGVYFVRIYADEGVVTQKIIVE